MANSGLQHQIEFKNQDAKRFIFIIDRGDSDTDILL